MYSKFKCHKSPEVLDHSDEHKKKILKMTRRFADILHPQTAILHFAWKVIFEKSIIGALRFFFILLKQINIFYYTIHTYFTLMHLSSTKMFKHVLYYFFAHVLSCQMSQCYKQVHDGPGCVCTKGWCACVKVSGNKGGLNEKNNRKAILSLWMSVTTDCMFTSALSPFYNAGGAQYLFTRSFIKNTSPASREWTSVRAFYSSLHWVTLQDITDLDRVCKTERQLVTCETIFHSLCFQMPLQHIKANISTWTYKHVRAHFSSLSLYTHTVLITPCEGHRGPLITGMGSFKSGRRTQCCSCRMERN